MVVEFSIGADARALTEPVHTRIGFVRVNERGVPGDAESRASRARENGRPATVVTLSSESFFNASQVDNIFGQLADTSSVRAPVSEIKFASVDPIEAKLGEVARISSGAGAEDAESRSVVARNSPTLGKDATARAEEVLRIGLTEPLVSNFRTAIDEVSVTALEAAVEIESFSVAQGLKDAVDAPGDLRTRAVEFGPRFGFEPPLLEPVGTTAFGVSIVPESEEIAAGAPPAVSESESALGIVNGPSAVELNSQLGDQVGLIGVTPLEEVFETAGVEVGTEASTKVDEGIQPSFETLFVPPPLTPSSSERVAIQEREPPREIELELVNRFGTLAQTAIDEEGMTEAQLREVLRLTTLDQRVRSHEQAHVSAAGGLAGAPSFTLKRGPDNRQYAVGGEVSIDTSAASSPEATMRKAETIRRAALAPADPSGQDRAVAAAAAQMERQAMLESAAVMEEEVLGAGQEAGVNRFTEKAATLPAGLGAMGSGDVAGITDAQEREEFEGLPEERIQVMGQPKENKEGPEAPALQLAGGLSRAHAAYQLAENAYQGRDDYIALA